MPKCPKCDKEVYFGEHALGVPAFLYTPAGAQQAVRGSVAWRQIVLGLCRWAAVPRVRGIAFDRTYELCLRR